MDHDAPLADNCRSNSGSPNVFGPSSSKRHRMNGPENPTSANDAHESFRRNSSPENNENNSMLPRRWNLSNNSNSSRLAGMVDHLDANGPFSVGRHKPDSLLSQALEKNPVFRPSLSGIEGGNNDDSASDSTSDRPESLMDGNAAKSSSSDIAELAIQRQSPAVAASAGNPLLPPGLEALYRQAGFPPAFFGLGGAGAGSGGGGPPGPSSSNTGGAGGLPGLGSGVPQVGLQSHAGNPNRKFNYILH